MAFTSIVAVVLACLACEVHMVDQETNALASLLLATGGGWRAMRPWHHKPVTNVDPAIIQNPIVSESSLSGVGNDCYMAGRATICAPRMAAARRDASDGDTKLTPILSLKSGPGIDPVESDEEDAVTDPRLRSFDVGPFSTSIGVRDKQSAGEPNFQEREDWLHVVSANSREELAAMSKEILETPSGAAVVEDSMEVETAEFVEPEYRFMKYDKGDIPDEPYVAQHLMPTNWQEYQAMQKRLAAFASGEGKAAPAQRQQAAELSEKLERFYETFKAILAEGWKLKGDPSIDEAQALLLELDGKVAEANMQPR